MPRTLYFSIAAILSFWIMSSSISYLNGPMDWDELDISSKIANREYTQSLTSEEEKKLKLRIPDVFDPRKNVRNHSVATVSALGSFLIFGSSKAAFRIPTLLFTAALLILLIFSESFLGKEIVLFLLAHLSVNALTLWYFHSSRGYVSLLLFTAALYLLGLKWVESGTLNRKERWAFYALFYLTPFTHAFGGAFAVMLLAALYFVSYRQSRGAEFKAKAYFLAPCLPVVLLVAYLSVYTLKFLSAWGNFMTNIPYDVSSPSLSLFGTESQPTLYAMGLSLLFIFGYAIYKKIYFTYRFIVPAMCWGAITVAFTILKPNFFVPRYILCFLLPTLILAGSLDAGRFAYVKWAALSILFLVLPLRERATYASNVPSWLASYDAFLQRVKTSVDASNSCFQFSGDDDECYFSRSLFFKNAANCKSHYHIHFGHNWQGHVALKKDPDYNYKLLFEDAAEHQLFELSPVSKADLATTSRG